MANQGGNAQAAVAAAPHTAAFRIPYTWDKNAPSFDTDDYEDLLKFVDSVEQIIALANITDDAEKKKLLTNYLPIKKKEYWRGLKTYTTGTFEEFLTEVYKSYPEVKSSKVGSIDNLVKICRSYKGITVLDEGLLRRFGVEFLTVVKKLLKGNAITTNSEACKRYLDTLEPSFATTLRMTISSTNIMKERLIETAAIPAPAQPATDLRKEDPIKIEELIQMAEAMAASQQDTSSDYHTPEITRSQNFPMVKKEHRDERIDELGGAIASLQDAFKVSQTQVQSAQAETKKLQVEMLNQLQQMKNAAPGRDPPPHKDIVQAGAASNFNGPDRPFTTNIKGEGPRDCFYCEQTGHFSRECTFKEEHIHKGWIVIENGRTRLGDGSFIPRGEGKSQRQRVEDYWLNRSLSQNWVSQAGYANNRDEEGERPMDASEAYIDEIRTLKVKLARAQGANAQRNVEPSLHPVFTTSTIQSPAVNAVPDITQALHALLLKGIAASTEEGSSQEQYVVTRAGPKQGGNNSNF